MTISRRLRFEILRRDDHTCRYCGAKAPDVKLTIDHVVPQALGGKDEPSNLVTACSSCNAGKSSIAPDSSTVDDVAGDAMRWARARHEAVAAWRVERQALTADLDAFAEAWDIWGTGDGDDRIVVPRENEWRATIERWLDAGFIIEDLIELIPRAMRASGRGGPIALDDRWRYYCGVVWRTLDDIEAATAKRLPDDETGPSDAEGADRSTAEAQAYNDGFEDGRNYERSRIQLPSAPPPCGDCGQRPAIPTIGLCPDCWGE